jgi:hypothetical protein
MKNHGGGTFRKRAGHVLSAIPAVLILSAAACGSNGDEAPAGPVTSTPRLLVTFTPATATAAWGESVTATITAQRARPGPRLSLFPPTVPPGVTATSLGASVDSLHTSITYRFDVATGVSPGTYRVTSTTCPSTCSGPDLNPGDIRTAVFLLTVAVGPR